ncbi:MAG: hypothetical protein C0410_10275 [Anaerolinea sp.]|nr:hypothetical protein [Anaerolinea sp.]
MRKSAKKTASQAGWSKNTHQRFSTSFFRHNTIHKEQLPAPYYLYIIIRSFHISVYKENQMPALKYLSFEWTAEAEKRLRSQLTPESLKNMTSSMLTVYHNCPDGQERALYYKIEDGVFTDISIRQDPMPEAEFIISGDYDTFAKISRAELGSRSALMNGKLRLTGNMVKALSLASIVDRFNKILSEIPCEY